MDSDEEITPEILTESKGTLKLYTSQLNQIKKNVIDKVSINNIINNYSKFANWIEARGSESTKRNYYNLLFNILKLRKDDPKISPYIEVLGLKMQNSRNKINDQYETNELKPNERVLTTEELNDEIQKYNNLLPKEFNNYSDYRKLMKYLILLLYKYYPLRLDYANMKILFSDELTRPQLREEIEKLKEHENNFMYINIKEDALNPSYIYLLTYKTKKFYGNQKTMIDEPIILNELIKYRSVIKKFSKGGPFMINEKSQPMDRHNLSVFITRLLGEHVGVSSLRKTAVNEVHKPKRGELKKKIKLAKKMGHSLDTATVKYAKVLN